MTVARAKLMQPTPPAPWSLSHYRFVSLTRLIPTITDGNIQNWDQVNTLLVSGQADLVALARAHLYDPYFTLHAAADQDYELIGPINICPQNRDEEKDNDDVSVNSSLFAV